MTKLEKFYIAQAIIVVTMALVSMATAIINIFVGSKVLMVIPYACLVVVLIICLIDFIKEMYDLYKQSHNK